MATNVAVFLINSVACITKFRSLKRMERRLNYSYSGFSTDDGAASLYLWFYKEPKKLLG